MCVPVHPGDATMLDTLPYADLLAIHNALADKPARRFDTRANGEKRALALMAARGQTLEDAARLADVVLGGCEGADLDAPVEDHAQTEQTIAGEAPAAVPDAETTETITVDAGMVEVVNALRELKWVNIRATKRSLNF